MPLRRVLCFLTQHRWSAAGECLRCGVRCRHAVSLYEPESRSAHCLDCGARTEDEHARSANGYSREQRPPRNLRQSIRDFISHFFDLDSDRWA